MKGTEVYTIRIRKGHVGKVEYICNPRLISTDSSINV